MTERIARSQFVKNLEEAMSRVQERFPHLSIDMRRLKSECTGACMGISHFLKAESEWQLAFYMEGESGGHGILTVLGEPIEWRLMGADISKYETVRLRKELPESEAGFTSAGLLLLCLAGFIGIAIGISTFEKLQARWLKNSIELCIKLYGEEC